MTFVFGGRFRLLDPYIPLEKGRKRDRGTNKGEEEEGPAGKKQRGLASTLTSPQKSEIGEKGGPPLALRALEEGWRSGVACKGESVAERDNGGGIGVRQYGLCRVNDKGDWGANSNENGDGDGGGVTEKEMGGNGGLRRFLGSMRTAESRDRKGIRDRTPKWAGKEEEKKRDGKEGRVREDRNKQMFPYVDKKVPSSQACKLPEVTPQKRLATIDKDPLLFIVGEDRRSPKSHFIMGNRKFHRAQPISPVAHGGVRKKPKSFFRSTKPLGLKNASRKVNYAHMKNKSNALHSKASAEPEIGGFRSGQGIIFGKKHLESLQSPRKKNNLKMNPADSIEIEQSRRSRQHSLAAPSGLKPKEMSTVDTQKTFQVNLLKPQTPGTESKRKTEQNSPEKRTNSYTLMDHLPRSSIKANCIKSGKEAEIANENALKKIEKYKKVIDNKSFKPVQDLPKPRVDLPRAKPIRQLQDIPTVRSPVAEWRLFKTRNSPQAVRSKEAEAVDCTTKVCEADVAVRRKLGVQLSPEDEELYEKCVKSGGNRVITKVGNVEFDGNKLSCLDAESWLNDEVINSYMRLLQERDKRFRNSNTDAPKCHFFQSFFMNRLMLDGKKYNYKNVQKWTKPVKLGNCGQESKTILDCDIIFFSIHLPSHWVLAAADLNEKKVSYYDSLMGDRHDIVDAIINYIIDEAKDKKQESWNKEEWKWEFDKTIPRQANYHDCGMFVLQYAKSRSEIQNWTGDWGFSQGDMENLRKVVFKEFVKNQLL